MLGKVDVRRRRSVMMLAGRVERVEPSFSFSSFVSDGSQLLELRRRWSAVLGRFFQRDSQFSSSSASFFTFTSPVLGPRGLALTALSSSMLTLPALGIRSSALTASTSSFPGLRILSRRLGSV